MDTRLSAAVQFFMEHDSNENKRDYKLIVQWLNEATLSSDNTRIDNLRRVKEVILKKDPTLLDPFLEKVLGFQTDRNAEMRSFLVSFIDEALKVEPDILPRVVISLSLLIQDLSSQVQKKVIQVASPIYKRTLVWLAKGRTVSAEVESAWNTIGGIKAQIVNMIDSENDGIRTHAVKFLETVVLTQTYPQPDSLRSDDDFSLEDVPLTLKIARRRKLEEEANMVFDLIVKFLNSPHISSINLMTAVGSLLAIAKARSQFMGKVLSTIDVLRNNLPPTLSASQIVSTTKHIKNQLLLMLKQLSSTDYHTELATLLTNLGATNHEISKSYPKLDELRRRQKRIAESNAAIATHAKRARLEIEDEDSEDDDDDDDEFVAKHLNAKDQTTAVSITETFIEERLSIELAAQLVLLTMLKLPDTMPPHFISMYTPISDAGTQGQISMVSHLLAIQLTSAGLGPGVSQAKQLMAPAAPSQPEPSVSMDVDDEDAKRTTSMPPRIKIKEESQDKPSNISTKPVKLRIKTLKLSEITKPLEKETTSKMMCSAMSRILQAERSAKTGGVASVRNKIITTLAATFTPKVREIVMTFILEDLRSHIELAFAWLYEEYSYLQGFNRVPVFLKQELGPEYNYNELLCSLAKLLMEMSDNKDRDMLLVRLYLEAPLITEDATDLLKTMCGEESRAAVGLPLLQELVIRRPPRQLNFLNALLVHTAHENNEIRERAIGCVVTLYDHGDLRSIIEEYSILYLGFLRLPHPPDVLFGAERGRPSKVEAWHEGLVKACLYLYLALLPLNQKLIQELARVYCQTSADVKRTVLRLLEQPVRAMGMDSPELLTLVEECPKGAETLVTRALHILTEKTPPSADLVARVRELYHTRVSDVRFLIPVLNGLTKKEIIAALPKLIKLNPVVVKEVFNRLLGSHSEATGHTTAITPAELLIALHNIDTSKCELKLVMKATSLCFNEQQAYTQEVLAVVMQNLMELNPLPTLLMRTVIQSLSLYPRLIGFVMNILQRLILKQVWKQKKVWEGFIKCCERTQPQSFQVLLQLPPPQLGDVLSTSLGLHQPLLAHVMAFTENQRAHVSQSIMDILLGKRLPRDEYEKMGDVSDLIIDIKEEPGIRLEPAPPGMD